MLPLPEAVRKSIESRQIQSLSEILMRALNSEPVAITYLGIIVERNSRLAGRFRGIVNPLAGGLTRQERIQISCRSSQGVETSTALLIPGPDESRDRTLDSDS